MSLPALEDTSSAPEPAPEKACVKSTRPRRILVVEDQPSLAHVTVALLRKLGHEVRAFIVQLRALAIDRLDLARARGADGRIVRLAHEKVILKQRPKRGH